MAQNVVFDENGRPFIILREQESRTRVHGVDAIKSHIYAARSVASIMRSSLGPKGMDKMLVSQDGDVTITNDGATIMSEMHVDNQIAKLMTEMSRSQDDEIGDGTTGVVVLAGSLLEHAEELISKGVHPVKISQSYDAACAIACKRLDEIAEPATVVGPSAAALAEAAAGTGTGLHGCVVLPESDRQFLMQAAETALCSKVVNSRTEELAQLCVDAVLAVVNWETRDVNLDLIKVMSKVGGKLEDAQLVRGIVLEKEFSHPQMPKELRDVRLAVLTCPFEPPKPKTKHKVELATAADFEKAAALEQAYFTEMIDRVQGSGATLALCQWGFDDEANHLLLHRGLPAIRWVGGVEIELVAIATGARIVPRFEECTEAKLGRVGRVYERQLGTTKDKILVLEECANSRAVTLLLRGGNTMLVAEAERAVHDALCVVRNLVVRGDGRVLAGGGAPELAAAIAVSDAADKVAGVEQYAMRAFSDALEAVPMALAENSGIGGIETLAEIRTRQIKENNPSLGIDCNGFGTNDMKEQRVFDTAAGKIAQFKLATQVVKMVMKIDDVIHQQQQ